MTTHDDAAAEREDLLDALTTHRQLLLRTVADLDDDAARRRTTVSSFTLGALVKHLTAMERDWAAFVVEGPDSGGDEAAFAESLVMRPEETLAGLVEDYRRAAEATDRLVRETPDLGATQPLPAAPWFPDGARRSARRVFVHLVAETAQHAGHADIIRESLDGRRTMG